MSDSPPPGKPVSDRQRIATLRFHTYAEVERMMAMEGIDFVQLDTGELQAESLIAMSTPWILDAFSTNLPLRVKGTRPQGDVAFLIYMPMSPGQIRNAGRALPSSHVFWRDHRFIPDEVIPPGGGGLAVRLTREAFDERFRPMLDAEGMDWIENSSALLPLSAAMDAWMLDWYRTTVGTLRDGDFTAEELAAVCEEFFLTILESLSANSPPADDNPRDSRNYDLITRAEQLTSETPNEPLQLPELCQALNCSLGTLHNAFVAHLGISPSRYLQIFRLNGVRRSLLQGPAGPGFVTRTALAWGFGHLGRFSQAYQDLFGELPKITARRAGRPADGAS